MISSKTPESNNSLLIYGLASGGTWNVGTVLCGSSNTFSCDRLGNLPQAQQVQAAQEWNMGGYKIDYCLSGQESVQNLCSVEYSSSIISSESLSPAYILTEHIYISELT